MALNLLELTDTPMVTAVTQEQGRAEATYRLSGEDEDTSPTIGKISEAFNYFTGGVSNIAPAAVSPGSNGAGKVVRVLPPVHPFRPELSCSGTTSMQGSGRHELGISTAVYGLDPVTEEFPLFKQYDYRVEFTKRPYFLLPDEKIELKNEIYYPPDGSSGVQIYYAEEWRRFTSTTREPTGETTSCDTGQMTFRTQSGTGANGKTYTGRPFIFLQNEMIEITWYQVPYRYFLNIDGYKPYLTRFTNTVNQLEWNGFDAGSLLFLGATPTPYIPSAVKQQKFLNAIAVGLDQNLLCNIKLKFLHTAREGTDVPTSGGLLTNKNNIPAGHNLMANFGDRRFYYAVGGTSADSDANRNATFQSFPFSLLFTDPMLMQQGGVI